MTDRTSMRRVAYWAALAGLAVSLAGCQTFSEAAGLTKDAPDEFAVTTKAPLIIPPDYNLKPPKPGAAPTNQVSPTDTAQDTLFGSDQMVTSTHGPISAGEQELLAKAGAANANDMIRQKIAADNRAMQASDESFTNRLLFGYGSNDSAGKPVDANAEAKRLGETGGSAGAPAKPQKADEDASPIQEDSGGWLDGIF